MEESTENRKKPMFGTRYLNDPETVFQHNAWDDVDWNDDLKKEAEEKLKINSEKIVPDEQQNLYDTQANTFWDKFYHVHQNRFFKDRHWLFTEFPELLIKPTVQKECSDIQISEAACENQPTVYIWEVGCGVGNTVFPVMAANVDANIFVYCCDFSEVAVSLVKDHSDFDEKRCHPFVCDVSSEAWDTPFSEGSLDYIILVFVLSAIHPDKMQRVVGKMSRYLKPGGQILFRDYGKYDMVELRFKPGQCLTDHFYVRGDGTRVFFFSEEEIDTLFTKAGLVKKQNFTSRRLQVNRGKLLKMYRIWVQAKYMKPM